MKAKCYTACDLSIASIRLIYKRPDSGSIYGGCRVGLCDFLRVCDPAAIPLTRSFLSRYGTLKPFYLQAFGTITAGKFN